MVSTLPLVCTQDPDLPASCPPHDDNILCRVSIGRRVRGMQRAGLELLIKVREKGWLNMFQTTTQSSPWDLVLPH